MNKLKRTIIFALVLAMMTCMFGYSDINAATKKTPAKPKIEVKVVDNTIKLTIKKTQNAEGFEVFVKSPGSSKYEKAVTIKKNGKSKRTYTFADLSEGTYKIKVRSYNGSKYSKYSAVKEAKIESGNNDVVTYTFRNKNLLEQHYNKHGIEMGFKTMEDYEKAASDVINNPKALFKTEAEDGDYVYYVEETNEFVVLSLDGFIRTYFLPSQGKKYFDRQ